MLLTELFVTFMTCNPSEMQAEVSQVLLFVSTMSSVEQWNLDTLSVRIKLAQLSQIANTTHLAGCDIPDTNFSGPVTRVLLHISDPFLPCL